MTSLINQCSAILYNNNICKKITNTQYCNTHQYYKDKSSIISESFNEHQLMIDKIYPINNSAESAETIKTLYYPDKSLHEQRFYRFGNIYKIIEYYQNTNSSIKNISNYKYYENTKKTYVDGHVYKYYENGILCSNEYYNEGYLEGPQHYYYSNGNLKQFYNYKAGVSEGTQYDYHYNNTYSNISNYKNGKLHGEQITYSYDNIISYISYIYDDWNF
jgi:antitoxin component YwqK of YwqJK toxin-antitoxin module